MAGYPQWLVAAKLQPNSASSRLLVRTGIGKIDDHGGARLVLTHAPAGYGKTSAMAQWHREQLVSGKCAAWLSLDDQDGDPYQFLCYLIASCREAGCSVDYELPPHPHALAGSNLDFLITAVLGALSRHQAPDFVFLDDFHRAENHATSTIVRKVIAGLASTTVVLSSRTFPRETDIADLRAHGNLMEVSQDQLQFSADEIESYLGSLLTPNDRKKYCRDIAVRTEGWPIALQAIKQLIKAGKPLDQALKHASGRSGVISDYFIEQVFNTLPTEQQNLLLSTAVLERVNGDLADAICDTDNGWSILDELEKNDVFVQSQDPERQWYRFHRLFAEFIAERARRSGRVDNQKNAARAAIWFRENGYSSDALQYALSSEKPTLIAETLESIGGWRHSVLGSPSGVEKALSFLPREILQAYPRVWMAQIYAKLKKGELKTANVDSRILLERFREKASPNTALFNELVVFDGLIAVYCDHHSRMSEHIERLNSMVATADRDDHFLHATRLNLLCGLYARTSEYSNAIAAGEASIHHYRKFGSLYGEVFIYFHQCFIFYRQGRLRDANATLNQGLDLAASHFGKESELYAIGAAFAALFSYDQNDRTSARRHLIVALPVIEQCDAWAEVFVAGYGASLSLAASQNKWEEAEQIHDRASATAAFRQLPRVSKFVDVYFQDLKIRRHGAKDKAPKPSRTISPVSVALEFDLFPSVCAHGRLLLHSGEYTKAVTFIAEHIELAREKQMIRAFITLSLLCAIAHRGAGDIDLASKRFEEVLGYALFEDFKRPIIDEGLIIAELIHDIENLASQQRSNRLRDKFLAELLAEISADYETDNDSEQLLSNRERDVLRGLIHGRSNREVSESLGISQNTVKFHLKNVFQKLGVSSREDAVRVSLRDRVL